MTRPIAALITVVVTLAAGSARAAPRMVAVIVGVNAGVDSELPALHYADDDAVLYRELFRQLGATTYLLTRPDDNTRRLHAEVTEARPPRRGELARATAEAAAVVATARASGAVTAFYFVYAGHGNVRDGQGYIGLEDDRLTGADLERRVLSAVGADQMHVIIDACYSGLLASTRGPGGERRPLHGFSRLEGLASDDRIGLLLSTTSARASHEWEGFQAGVFSYEVRSGMYGAADADGDGTVSYREIAAFVARANAAIPNERFRPDVYARPPRRGDQFLDLRGALRRRLEIDGKRAGHWVLEDAFGVRVLDFHNSVDQGVAIIRPAGHRDLFLRRVDDNQEYRVVADAADVLTIDGLAAGPLRVMVRGAAHESFNRTFLLQFDAEVVRRFGAPWGSEQRGRWSVVVIESGQSIAGDERLIESWLTTRRKFALGLAGAAAVSAVTGALLGAAANAKRDDAYHLCRDPAMVCPLSANVNGLLDAARTRAHGANIAFGVSAVLVVSAGVLWFTGAPAATQTRQVHLQFGMVPGEVGVLLAGSL